jgi:hypothetical protein
LVVVDVVVAVSVEVSAVVLLMLTEDGERLQVAGLTGFKNVVVTAQLSVTVPVNELPGVTVMVEALPLLAPGLTVMSPLLLRVKLVELLPLGASQKFPHPARKPAETISGTATINCLAHLPIFIAAPASLPLLHLCFGASTRAGFRTSRVPLPSAPCPAVRLDAVFASRVELRDARSGAFAHPGVDCASTVNDSRL